MTAALRAWAAAAGPQVAREDELAEHVRFPAPAPSAAVRLQIELGAAAWARESRVQLASRLSAQSDPAAHQVGLEAAAAQTRVLILVSALQAVTQSGEPA